MTSFSSWCMAKQQANTGAAVAVATAAFFARCRSLLQSRLLLSSAACLQAWASAFFVESSFMELRDITVL
jgi:hypothetical protein